MCQSRIVAVVVGSVCLWNSSLAAPLPDGVGRTTGLPIPRFVSVKANPANVRVGPGSDYPIRWTFVRRGLPVEITAEFGQWRQIRDWSGKSGWIYGGLLTGRRTAMVAPWPGTKLIRMRASGRRNARVAALVQRHVLVRIESCDGTWCEVRVKSYSGFIQQTNLWGVYPGEVI
jgi:SH3-like domain-containing protein